VNDLQVIFNLIFLLIKGLLDTAARGRFSQKYIKIYRIMGFYIARENFYAKQIGQFLTHL
jgi:hypothetical protein